jgi:tetratricopeptide (TPR) repeat protein
MVAQSVRLRDELAKETAVSDALAAEIEDMEDLEILSNSVLDLIRDDRLDEAERVCQKLARDYPDQIDGIDRLALVHEARGDRQGAIALWRKAIDFTLTQPDGFDDDSRAAMQSEIERLKADQPPTWLSGGVGDRERDRDTECER